MESVTVCRLCGRTIDVSFIFCPWCGASRVGGDAVCRQPIKHDNPVFQKLEKLQEKGLAGRITKMEESLNELERDLLRFMEAPEKR